MRVLVVAAHPDDEVLGCGGTMARLAREGHEVYVAILGEGVTSRYREPHQDAPALVEGLRTASQKAGGLLGAVQVWNFGLPDNRFDTVPLLEVIKLVEGVVARVKPQVIYGHHSGDLNIDHGVAARAVLTATRPFAVPEVREVYAFEVPSATECAFQRLEPAFRPNILVDITLTLELKLEAMSLYETELRPFPHPRSLEALRATARRWGTVAGCEAAEAFELIRAIRR